MNKILSVQEYEQLVDQAPILIWRANTSMGCDYFNDRWLKFTGRTLEEEYGNGWATGVHGDDYERCVAIYQESFQKREIFEMEYRLRRYDGEYRWIFDRGVPFFHADGVFGGYIGSCVDVTERVEAQAALRKAHEAELHQLRQLLPVCAGCGKVRDDQGYWSLLETYLQKNSNMVFSHGLCPNCIKSYFPDSE
jgi:PAS domain S-box-containing protein